MDRTAVQRAMWDRLEVEKNELKAEFGGRVDRLYETIKLEVEHVYGNVQEDIVPVVPRSPSPLTTPNESRLNSIQQQDNVDNNIITPPPAANSPDHITHHTTEHNSTRTELLTVNLIEGGQNADEEQSSSTLAIDVASQPSSTHHHHDIRVIQTETVPFDSSSNMPNSSDHHRQPDNSQQPNSVSISSLTDQNGTTEMQQQQIKQELSDEATTNDRNEQSNDGDSDGDIVKDEYFSECEDDSDCLVPEIKGEFDYGQAVEIRQEEDEEEDTTDNEEMMDIEEEEEEEEEEEDDDKTLIDDIEGLAQDNQTGGDNDESRSVDNAPMDTTAAHQIGQSNNVQNASNESIEQGCANLSSEQLLNTANQSDDPTVTQSGGDLLAPSTSTGRRSNRAALNQQATASTGGNATKRKQPTSNRSAKRSKKTIEEDDGGEDGEDSANEDREETKVKLLYLNCTVENCNVQLDSLANLNNHLSTELAPLQCFATNCKARFDKPMQLHDHFQLQHPVDTRFLCSVCSKEYDSQHKAYTHWYKYHLTGQFECNFVSDCTEVSDTRRKMSTHQQTKHYSQSKNLHCTHPGCTASFAFKTRLERHELTHRDTSQFHCNWPHCSKQYKLLANLVKHIRTKHFGLPLTVKAQKEKNIVDLRDPNEYVRVVVDE